MTGIGAAGTIMQSKKKVDPMDFGKSKRSEEDKEQAKELKKRLGGGKRRMPTDIKSDKLNKLGQSGETKDKVTQPKKKPSKGFGEEYYDWRSTLDEKCWKGYEKKGMKTMFGKRYPNCVKKTKKEELEVEASSLDEKLVHGNFGNYIKGQKLPKNTEKKYKEPPYKDLAASVDLEGNVVSEKKMTKKQMKKRDEIADAISTKDMKDRYGDKNVKYAIATKLAMKEDVTDEALLIQDWNVDEIKYTEVEAVDIIKPEPLKPSPSNWRMDLGEDWQSVNRKDKTDGMSKKAVKAYRKENPGSKLKTAVTKDPKKLKKGSKSAKRRLSFCRRMKGMKKKLTSAKTSRDPDSRINKALRRWNC
jgi:hypothetical protein